MNAFCRHLALPAMVALVHLLAGCSDDSSGPTAREGANPGGVCEDQDEPGDVDENDEEDDDGDEDDDECEDDD